jgi:nitric oxide reductase subunit B
MAQRRAMLISSGWLQAALIVFLIGFTILGVLAYQAYTDHPPVPERVVSTDGRTVYTGEDVRAGQQIFLQSGLMQYGSVFGHGGYLGPDYTADYLRRASIFVARRYGESEAEGGPRTFADFRTNRYDAATGQLTVSAAQAGAFDHVKEHLRTTFARPSAQTGLRPGIVSDPGDLHDLTAFFGWSAWAAAAQRPGLGYSYTNNWPPEPRVQNRPTGAMVVWSVLSLIALLGGVGLLLGAFGRWRSLGWHAREEQTLSFRRPGTVALTPGQRATAWFFVIMAALFLVQTLVGAASQHYRAELSNFFGFDLARYLPFNLMRTWHVQLALFWVATSFLAAGIFIAPMVAGREPAGQRWLAFGLLGALVVVVVGSLVGEMAGIHGWSRDIWLANQGFEYLDLGRLWQVLLVVGLFFWVAMLWRTLRPRLAREHVGNMPWLFFFAALAIPAFYAVGLLAHPRSHFSITEFWRFWVVHLWVEDFLELFTTVMVAYLFVLLGVVAERVALRLIYLEMILYAVGGVVGTMHHLYFSGGPVSHMALGAFFSAAEVIPLTFLTVEAWSFLQLGRSQWTATGAKGAFPHRWAIMFLVAVGFWNFLGAGIFGFLINLPIVSYYEIGTALTSNHGHASMMGVYGMLAAGLAMFAVRYLVPDERWPERLAKVSFWSLNIGLAWMVFATLFPIGVLQLERSVSLGYFEARELEYLTGGYLSFIEWMRLPGDVLFIVGGILPLLWICLQGVRHARGPDRSPGTDSALFTEITGGERGQMGGATAAGSTGELP